ncbi:adenosylcobinamide-GDP ribazoletransferase [Thalassolituus sp. LLYu03]|uniref:adenosylcobinamide-GDP ribazoletransferase n=1 Tax=Thalassolituus sp. LLYu03 TaxID=3421656 RepID=UPI003D2D5FD3
MTTYVWAFWYALTFLTRLPAPYLKRTDNAVAGASLLFYPLIGAIIGAAMLGFTLICVAWNPQTNLLLLSALILLVWTAITGALHLDGLADSADAWVGGLGNKERTLAIMKDPRSGPIGVTAIMLVLLVKFTALYSLLDMASAGRLSHWNFWLLIGGLLLVPMLARGSVLGLLATTPYVREQGIASALTAGATRNRVLVMGAVLAILVGIFLQGRALVIIALWLTLVAFARQLMMKRLGGCTGDTIGATIEVQEALLLAAIAL